MEEASKVELVGKKMKELWRRKGVEGLLFEPHKNSHPT